ncbi:MAG TPA: LysM peptidoglycan-binding domain-containing protein, partial [Candidatus Binatia bacterium]|nr:LysM peptidoglycan-binding domain-containing protein [Candidatus Binatia bacterium]
GIEIMLRELSARDPKAKAAKPEDFVNLTFIKELDSSGFIDRLYKTPPVVASRELQQPAPGALIAQEAPAQANLKTRSIHDERVRSLPNSTAAPESGQYTVAAGDTLSYLALKYYGDQYKWEKIYEANKPAMKSPHSLYVGQKILIPILGGKLMGDQTLPVSDPSPVYSSQRPTATNISDVQ